jgi:ethanolamine ammonia-lyase small subunit
MAEPPKPADPFLTLRGATPARIGLGRAGQGLPTAPMLAFQLAHAQAKDAVSEGLDVDALQRALDGPSVVVKSQAPDRTAYLQRPDLGRRLQSPVVLSKGDYDLVLIIADGLCAAAAQIHGPPVARAVIRRLADWRIAPVVIAEQARVALGDPIGEAVGAGAAVILLGERPGLSAAVSLSAYITADPKPGRRDSERNCVSNIRSPFGLDAEAAADTIVWILREARRLGFTGVDLKARAGLVVHEEKPARLGAVDAPS